MKLRVRLLSLVSALERSTTGVGVVGAWLICPLIAATCFEVFCRYALGRPTIWAYDVGYMLTGSHFLLGSALTLRAGEHVRIDVLYSRFSLRSKALIDAVGFAVIALPVTLVVGLELWSYAVEAYLDGEASGTSAWNPPIWPFRFVFFSGFLLLFLQCFSELLKAGLLLCESRSSERASVLIDGEPNG